MNDCDWNMLQQFLPRCGLTSREIFDAISAYRAQKAILDKNWPEQDGHFESEGWVFDVFIGHQNEVHDFMNKYLEEYPTGGYGTQMQMKSMEDDLYRVTMKRYRSCD